MVQPKTLHPDNRAPRKLGDEEPTHLAMPRIRQTVADTGDRILHHTTFDYGRKTMALTLQGIILTDATEPDHDGQPSVSAATYGDILSIQDTGHDREIRIRFRDGGDATHRMGDAQTVTQLKSLLRSYRDQFNANGDPLFWEAKTEQDETTSTTQDQEPTLNGNEEQPSIAERVQFWEEQDRINQVLIPRVIRQNELLAKHIAEHDDLPELIGRVVSDALSEQATLYNEAMEQSAAELRAAYERSLGKTRQELQAQYAEALDKANTEQQVTYEGAISTVRHEASRTRKWTTTVATVAIGVAVAAIIIAVLL